MYHYVREIKKGNYPNLYGLEFKDFKKQVHYFSKNFNILNNEDLIEILKTKKIPKKKSVLLTFDDGYKDHYKYVYPFLKEKKISGNFYPTVQGLKNKKVLDINKIHFILEKENNRDKILKLIFKFTKKFANKTEKNYPINKIKTVSRYDDKKTEIIKRLLQNVLPLNLRSKILNSLFNEIIKIDEKKFSKSLYMNNKQIIEMHNDKMTIGSHGDHHYWWDNLNFNKQLIELKTSIEYFKKIKIYKKNFSVCYPYGSFNSDTLNILKNLKVKFALTTKLGSIHLKNINNNLALPRYDTNDFK